MAVRDFKNIETRTAFRILDKDRKIIERGIQLSQFGKGKEDFIEFTMYDASNNQLPQGESGELTRYISVNQLNINEYFLVKDNGNDGGVEYFIDVEKLIREAGYNQGIFKIQYQLLNNRVGRHNTEKLYIHEIAPSRTEVRLVPVTNADGTVDEDLFKRYQTFTSGGTFRDDVQYFIEDFLDSIKFNNVIERMVSKFGQAYIDQIKKEFKINSIDEFVMEVTNKVKESARYFVDGKVYDPKALDYGQPLPNAEENAEFLDINELLKNILRISCDVVDILLPKRNINDETFVSNAFDPSVDVKSIIKTLKEDTTYTPNEPPRGSGDSNAPSSGMGSGVGSGLNDVEEFTEEDVQQAEEEIIKVTPNLTVSPKQDKQIDHTYQNVSFTYNSTSRVKVTIESTSPGEWWKTSQRTLPAGSGTFRLTVNGYNKMTDEGTLSPGLPTGTGSGYGGGGSRGPGTGIGEIIL